MEIHSPVQVKWLPFPNWDNSAHSPQSHAMHCNGRARPGDARGSSCSIAKRGSPNAHSRASTFACDRRTFSARHSGTAHRPQFRASSGTGEACAIWRHGMIRAMSFGPPMTQRRSHPGLAHRSGVQDQAQMRFYLSASIGWSARASFPVVRGDLLGACMLGKPGPACTRTSTQAAQVRVPILRAAGRSRTHMRRRRPFPLNSGRARWPTAPS